MVAQKDSARYVAAGLLFGDEGGCDLLLVNALGKAIGSQGPDEPIEQPVEYQVSGSTPAWSWLKGAALKILP